MVGCVCISGGFLQDIERLFVFGTGHLLRYGIEHEFMLALRRPILILENRWISIIWLEWNKGEVATSNNSMIPFSLPKQSGTSTSLF